MRDTLEWGVAEAAEHIRTRRISSRDYFAALMRQIEAYEPLLRAWTIVDSERAFAEAVACDEETAKNFSRGPLHGVPIAIKDNLDVAGLATRGGSDLVKDEPALDDAVAVARLRRAGAIVLGKTAMTPFAAMDPAATRNPWNGHHTPGGSSSGSAAAVAARMCPAALGSQTAGSVLRPASYCGVVGLKPTYDAIDRQGLMACAWSMDHIGVITRDMGDAELLFDVLAETTQSPEGSKAPIIIGIADRGFDVADAEDEKVFDEAVSVLANAGARIARVQLPAGFEALAAAGIVTMYGELAAFHSDLFSRRSYDYPPRLRVLIETGLSIAAADYVNAQRVRHGAALEMSNLLNGLTVLLTPTTAAAAPLRKSSTGDWRFNLPFSASGHPAITLPCGFSKSGLPLGIQAVSAHRQEHRLFAVGSLFQQHSDWHRQYASMTNLGFD
jgi:aspartyl-tRNA(Asn)/glutamyl-tRNA(Gln) amidotransferase subunit A